MDLRTGNLNFLRPLIVSGASADRIALPPMAMKGKVSMRGQRYDADLRLRESEGTVKLKAGADLAQMAYRAKLDDGKPAAAPFPAERLALQPYTLGRGQRAWHGYVQSADRFAGRSRAEGIALRRVEPERCVGRCLFA